MLREGLISSYSQDSDSDSNLSSSFGSNRSLSLDLNDNNSTSFTAEASKKQAPTWIPFGEALVAHRKFFKKGIVIVKSINTSEQDLMDSEIDDLADITAEEPSLEQEINGSLNHCVNEKKKSFIIREREFTFYSPNMKNSEDNGGPSKRDMNASKNLLLVLSNFSREKLKVNSSVTLYNKLRRQEVFFPLILDDVRDEQKKGMYVYPWLNKISDKFNFTGFTRFVTAGCLFGSSLKGIDKNGGVYELIKHDLELFKGQKFVNIELMAHNNPYQLMLFSELENYAKIINGLAKYGQPKQLIYHLPYYDYILFGVGLFIQDKITQFALNKFFNIIFARREEYIQHINTICQKYGIEVTIESPFDNLFGNVNCADKRNLAKNILETLGLKLENSQIYSMNSEAEEQRVAQACLMQLQENKYSEIYRQVWQDFGKIVSPDNIKTIEDLFSIANSVVLARTSIGTQDYEVCSLLPLPEKPIQLKYNTYYHKEGLQDAQRYSKVFYITTFDPLVTYSLTSKSQGVPFYFGTSYHGDLSQLIRDKKILEVAYRNVGLFANKMSSVKACNFQEKPIELSQVLTSLPTVGPS